jgi:hypothetical protein
VTQCSATTALYDELAGTIGRENRECHLRLNDVYTWGGKDPLKQGLDLTAVSRHLGSMVNQDHQEQKGRRQLQTVPAHHAGMPYAASGRSRHGSQLRIGVAAPDVQTRPLAAYDTMAGGG